MHLLHPLNALLKIQSKWSWSIKCSNAFKVAKKLLVTAPVLAHYNQSLIFKNLTISGYCYGNLWYGSMYRCTRLQLHTGFLNTQHSLLQS